MIKLSDILGNEYKFEITKFPDGTSQCWKINPEPARMTAIVVTWMFENEAELFHVCQLGELLYKKFHCFPTLNTPYLPFARQDKLYDNNLTFAKNTFINLVVASGYTKITTYDAHSGNIYVESEQPKALIEAAMQDGYNYICFPDKGAKERYSKLVPEGVKVIYGDKRRNQQTGAIEGISIDIEGSLLDDQSVLVFDDICDAGGTFIGVANELNSKGSLAKLGLAISHGIFSKGIEILFNNGYETVYTTNSLLKNIPMINPSGYMGINGMRENYLKVIDILK